MRIVSLISLVIPLGLAACAGFPGMESGSSSSGGAEASSSSSEEATSSSEEVLSSSDPGTGSSQELSSSQEAASSSTEVSSTSLAASSSSAGNPCAGYATPTQASTVCTCPAAHQSDCQSNGCYGGWWCDLNQRRCVAAPASSCGAASSSSSTASSGSSSGGSTFRVLFDAAHRQTEGNANWVVDSTSPSPTPSSPASETDWSGGISAWGYDLFRTGRYVVKQLPNGTALNHGGGGNGDLSTFDVFISDEPEAYFTAAEKSALMAFVNAGGGVFLIADHAGAVRCGRCVESPEVLNDFLVSGAGTAFGVKCDGNTVGDTGLTGLITTTDLANKIHYGPFGVGSRLAYHSGTSVSLTGGNASAEIIISASGTGMMALASVGNGRLALVGDSSPADDGTCACSAQLSDGWGEVDDRVVLLNATAWLAHDGS